MTMEQKKIVWKEIETNWEEQLTFLRRLIRCQSVLGRDQEVQMAMAQKLRQMGLDVDIFTPDVHRLSQRPGYSPVDWSGEECTQVAGVLKGFGGDGRTLVLNGHADVVPVEDERLWAFDPWEGNISGDRLYGRGAVDMKSGLSAIVFAMQAVIRSGIRLKRNVVVQSVTEEESSGNGTLACIDRGYRGDAALIAEPTDHRLLTGETGTLWAKITVDGFSAHVQNKDHAVNAVEKAMTVIQALKEIEAEWNRENFLSLRDVENPIFFNVGKISGGCWPSSVPERCVMEVRIGIWPETDPGDAQRALERELTAKLISDPWLREHQPRIRWFGHRTAGYAAAAAGDPFYQLIGRSHREVRGTDLTAFQQKACTDARFYILYEGIPAACYGPSGGNEHGTDEYVLLPSLMDTTKVIASVILDYCGCN